MNKIGMNPWLCVWKQPGKTIKAMFQHPTYRMPLLAALYGIPVMFQLAANLSMGMNNSSMVILAMSVILGFVIGYIGIYVMGALLQMVSKWFGGKGSYANMRVAVMWSTVPNAIIILCWLILMFTYGKGIFMYNFPRFAFMGGMGALIPFLSLVQLVASIWQIVILIQGIQVVQNFSVGRAIGALVVFLIIVAIIAIIVGAIAGALAYASMK